jgi:hypothetical protein
MLPSPRGLFQVLLQGMPIHFTTNSHHHWLLTQKTQKGQGLFWENTAFTPKNLQNLNIFYQQESGKHTWEYIQRMLNQEGLNIRLLWFITRLQKILYIFLYRESCRNSQRWLSIAKDRIYNPSKG